MNLRSLFLSHLAPTSFKPLAIEIIKAKGSILWSPQKKYIDLIGGISVSNIGHSHPKVVKAISKQAKKYSHVMVYGECVLSPQVEYATLLTKYLPPNLQSVYFTNSGTEATEGAIKLAKKKNEEDKTFCFS